MPLEVIPAELHEMQYNIHLRAFTTIGCSGALHSAYSSWTVPSCIFHQDWCMARHLNDGIWRIQMQAIDTWHLFQLVQVIWVHSSILTRCLYVVNRKINTQKCWGWLQHEAFGWSVNGLRQKASAGKSPNSTAQQLSGVETYPVANAGLPYIAWSLPM